MPAIDFSAAATGVVTAILVSLVSWILLKFTKFGKDYWRDLGRKNGGWETALLCILSLVLSLSALISTTFQPTTIKVAVTRIGPNGIETAANKPGEYIASNARDFVVMPDSKDADICTVNYLQEAGGSCLLHKEEGVWKIKVSGAAICRGQCYKLSLGR